MVVGAIGGRTELAIIGAGPGGYAATLRAADAGIEVTLIDRGPLGGTCLNVGCIPSKTLIEVANARYNALALAHAGLEATVRVDGARLQANIGAVTQRLRTGVHSLLEDAGVHVLQGIAHFARYDRLSIEVGDQVTHLEFDNAIVATGSRPRPVPGLGENDRILDSTAALALQQVPSSMVVLGGGYIGVELGTAWAKLGARVTIVEAAERMLPLVPRALAAPVVERLEALGVELIVGGTAAACDDTGVVLSSGRTLEASAIVAAVGRRPNSDSCSVQVAGVHTTESGHIVVDDRMRAAAGVFAIGDVVPGPALAHKATAQARVAVETICGRAARFDPAAIPEVIFSDPEILMVGESPTRARELGLRVHRFPHLAASRAHMTGSTTGLTIIVTDPDDTVVGVHACGPRVSELAGEACLAVEMAATLEDLSATIHPHPTMSETVAEVAWLAQGAPLHVRQNPI